MIVELKRTSSWSTSPDPIAKEETRLITCHCTCKTLEEAKARPEVARWFFREGSQNHRKTARGVAHDFPQKRFLADIPSLEWAVEKWGELVIQSSDVVGVQLCVEIYDDYRE